MQERDKLTIAAEGATRMRIKNQEVLDKEEQIRALLAANHAKLDRLLALRGKGVSPAITMITSMLEFDVTQSNDVSDIGNCCSVPAWVCMELVFHGF